MFARKHALAWIAALAILLQPAASLSLAAQDQNKDKAPGAQPAAPAAPTAPPVDTATPPPPVSAQPAPPAQADNNNNADDGGNAPRAKKLRKRAHKPQVRINLGMDAGDGGGGGGGGANNDQSVAVGKDVTVAAGQKTDNLVAVMGTGTVDGDVSEDAVVIGGKLVINGHVHGDAVNVGAGLVLGPKAVVDGDAVAIGGGLRRDAGATIGGEVVNLGVGGLADMGPGGDLPVWVKETTRKCLLLGRPLSFGVGWVWLANLGFFLFYLVLSALFPSGIRACRAAATERPLASVLYGIFGIPLLCCVMLILAVTFVGAIAIPFLFAGAIVASFFGKASLFTEFGARLLRLVSSGAAGSTALALLVGCLLVSLVYLVPYLAAALWLVLALWGLGVAMAALFRRDPSRSNPGRGSGSAPRPVGPAPAPRPAPSAAPTVSSITPLAGFAAAGSFADSPTSPTSPLPSAPPPAGESTSVLHADMPAVTGALPPIPPPSEIPPGGPPASGAAFSATPPPSSTSQPRPGFAPRFDRYSPSWLMTQPRPRLAKRAAALLIDFLAVGIISHLVPVAGFLLVLVVAFLYQWGMIYWRGATLGGMLLKLKVARTDGNPMDASIAGVRAAASFLSIFSLGLGWIWAHWDPDKQSWHDKLAGTVIVELQQAEALI